MIVTKILYFILIIISVLFYFLYIGDLSLYLMIFILSLPILLGIIILIAKFKIKFDISAASPTSIKNEKCKFILTIKNNTVFPFSNSCIKIEYKNKLSGIKNYMNISVPIHPLTEEKLNFYLSSDYCGILNIKIQSVKIYDFIKLFSCKIKLNVNKDIYILPNINFNNISHVSKTFNDHDNDIYSKIKSGDDPSEIFELKNYIPGDKISRIHWNLSFIRNKFITKYYSQPINSSIIVILDLVKTDSIYSIDTAIELFYDIAINMIKNEITFEICYYNSQIQEIEYINVSDIDTLIEMTIILMNHLVYDYNYLIINDIDKICINKSEIYLITNRHKNNEILRLFDNNYNTEKSLIFVSDTFSKSKFKYSENLTIAEIPAGKINENIEKILK